MAPQGKPNRHYLLCPVCVKPQESLPVHLRRVCMKTNTPEAIEAEVKKAKSEVHDLLASGRVFSYVLLRQIMDDADPLNRLIEELQSRHLAVTGIPPPLPNANVTATTSQPPERAATETMTDAEKSLVAHYLTHSTVTAEKHYRMKQPETIVRASQLLAKLAGDSSVESADEGPSHGTRGAAARHAADKPLCTSNVQMDVQAALDKLLETHPVTLDGDVPNRNERRKVSPDYQRQLYERWLKAQMKLRVQHVLSYYCRRLPTDHRLSSWISKQGWEKNLPTCRGVIREWKPSGSMDTVMDSKPIQKLTSSQKWRGLLVTDVEGKGKGVIATRRFLAGEVVCDYHGRVITAKEGHQIHQNTSEEETGYMFFYTNHKGQPMCIDAHSSICECHPEKQTVGRFVNHSKAEANIRPRFYSVDIDGQEKEVIVFLATRNIDVNEELLFDYGVGKKSFRGEGLGLAWLS